MAKAVFNNSNNAFFQSLKQSVDQYFSDKKLKKTGNWKLHLKTIILFSLAIGTYVVLLNVSLGTLPYLALWALLGLCCASIGFNVMHDACHGSYSSKEWVNNAMGMSLNLLGANSFFWKQKHNIIHHTYTNIDGIDDDIAKSPIIRQCESQKWLPAHKIQHIYLPLVYGITSIAWLFIMDFTKYFKRDISGTSAWNMSAWNKTVFWLTKIYYVSVFAVIPIWVLGWKAWLIGFLTMHVVMGIWLALVFQLAHVVEKTEFEHVPLDATKSFESAWAEHQVKTTSNFAMKNKVINWLVGGLNFQVEHHLFPKMSHVHYPAISKIVEEKCKEYNLPYNYYTTMSGAIASHFRFMKFLGKKPQVQMVVA